MSAEAKLGWAGMVLGIIGAIPTLLAFVNEQIVVGLLTTIILVGLVSVIGGMYWLLNQPSFTILNIEKKISFHNNSDATYTEMREARANHKGLTEL